MLKKLTVSMAVALLFAFVVTSYVAAIELPGTTNDGFLASISKEWLDKAIDYETSKDYEALQKLLDAKMVFYLQGGIKVFITYPKGDKYRVKIRKAGQTYEVWTHRFAVTMD